MMRIGGVEDTGIITQFTTITNNVTLPTVAAFRSFLEAGHLVEQRVT
jgi:hypothetical protein